jgi:acetyl-CoA decarbonylase/synthase complex subunit delta
MEAEAKANAEAEEKTKAEAEAKAKTEAEAKARAEEEGKARAETEEEAKAGVEEKAKEKEDLQNLRYKRALEREKLGAERKSLEGDKIPKTPASQQLTLVDKLIQDLDRIHRRV